MKLEKFPIFLIFPYFPAFSNLQLCKSKNPQGIQQDSVENSVDNVDNLLSKELFAHFYNISVPSAAIFSANVSELIPRLSVSRAA